MQVLEEAQEEQEGQEKQQEERQEARLQVLEKGEEVVFGLPLARWLPACPKATRRPPTRRSPPLLTKDVALTSFVFSRIFYYKQ